jgi:hypothetical protein
MQVEDNLNLTGVLLNVAGSNIVAAATTDLSTATGNNLSITGNTTITSFGTVTAGAIFTLTFTGTPVITYNGTSLILPTAANITAAAGDVIAIVSLGSGNWKCTGYTRANGQPLASLSDATKLSLSGGTMTGLIQGAKSANIASASTTDLSTATGNYAHITGTTTITAFGTLPAGTTISLVFDGILTLTYNVTSLILPTSANITTVAGDSAVFESEGSGNWRCVSYNRLSGAPLTGSSDTTKLPLAGGTMTGLIQGAKSSNIASASTTDLSTATGNYIHITGTTTITSFGTVTSGTHVILVFDGALTLTYNATSLILPTAANIITAAGDAAIFESEGSGNWRCVLYQRGDGTPLNLWAYSSKANITIQAVTTNPTKATSPDFDFIRSRRCFDFKWVEVDMLYAASSGSGSANGSGNYLFTLPNSLQWDTSEHSYYTGSGTNGIVMTYPVNSSLVMVGITGFEGDGLIIPYDATRFRILSKDGNGFTNYVGSGNYNIGGGNAVYNVKFKFKSL